MSLQLEDLTSYTNEPGVYLMKNRAEEVLYVGKAKNLKQRIRQYFIPGRDTRAMVTHLVAQVETIEVIVVLTEKEALLLESNLIKRYQPRYNVLLKDDKGYIRLKINSKHPWPSVQIVRYKGQPKAVDGMFFGPYPSARAAREILSLIHRLFPLRRCSDQELKSRVRPCLLYQMRRCIAPCVNKCTPEEYQEHLRHASQFLQGKSQEVLDYLTRQIEQASNQLEFERAGELHKMLAMVNQTISKQLVDQVEAYDRDVVGLYRQADELVISLLQIRQGKLMSVRHFPFAETVEDDQEIIISFLLQHYGGKEQLPHELLVPWELGERKTLEEILSDNKKRKIHILTPQRGSKTELLDMAYKNAKAFFEKEKEASESKERILLEMQDQLHLLNYPARIECFDNSHLGGASAVAAMVSFWDGFKDPSSYRKFQLRTVDPADDYGAMREVLTRRCKRSKEDNSLPDLIVLDGGKGHLNVGIKVLQELNITGIDLISIAKEQGRHDKGGTLEQVFVIGRAEPILLSKNSPILFMLQQIRDEAHRFVITFQRNLRSRRALKTQIEEIPGIGSIKKQRLLSHFGSAKRIEQASDEALLAIKGVNKKDVVAIRNFYLKPTAS